MPKYRAILFDLFGTVAILDLERLPLFEWRGQTVRSTLGALRTLYEERVTEVPFSRFCQAVSEVAAQLAEERTRDLREVPCARRFFLTLRSAGLSDGVSTQNLAEELSLVHAGLLASVTAVPPSHANLLAQACARYDVALVSNFDHGPTARRILGNGGISDHFHRIVISDEHGWRKPHPQIFIDTLNTLGVSPEEALFVGDSPAEDIVGAKKVGMDVAWVNATGAALPDGMPIPEYTVLAIPELEPVLLD